MKAVNIEWDEKSSGVDLPTEIEIPDELISGVNADRYLNRFEERMEAISDYITEQTGFCHFGFNVEISRKDAIQYALDQGTGIEYEPDLGETTEKEIASSGTKERSLRYVEPHTVDYFMQQTKEMQFCLIAHMDLIDFDEWMAVRDAFDVDLPYPAAAEIINMLYENHDYSTLEMPDAPKETVKDTVGIDISREEEQMIYNIVSVYGSSVKMSEPEKAPKKEPNDREL